MLEGQRGPAFRKAMEILCRLGEIYGAERMVPVSSVHMPGSSVIVAGEAGTRFVEETAARGGVFGVYTTLNPAAGDLERWSTLGFPPDVMANQQRLTAAYRRMGAVACHTCTPYLLGQLPRLGEHVAWGESSAVAFANSVLGARTNREGGPSALASALTGCAPAYGLHLDENRRGQVLVRVGCELRTTTDYGRLGYLVGRECQDRIPVFTGIPASATLDELKMLGAALASSGSVALFHVAGVTPEALTAEAAFGGRGPEQSLDVTESDLAAGSASLNRARGEPLGLVAIGCPHASVQEIREVAARLKGSRLHDSLHLWVMTAGPTRQMADRMGYTQAITEAGGQVICDTCPILAPARALVERFGYRSVATNSAKLAHYAPGQWGLPVYFGDLEQCIRAAISGNWG